MKDWIVLAMAAMFLFLFYWGVAPHPVHAQHFHGECWTDQRGQRYCT
jgi:hypothetical protein